jgi:hypothetical protein
MPPTADPLSAQSPDHRARRAKKSLLSTLFAFSLVAALMAGCAGSEGTGIPPTAANVPAEPTRLAVPSSAATSVPEAGVTVTGTVMDASPSAKIIMLERPDQGIGTIALTDETRLLAANGETMTLTDIHRGDSLKAHGRLGTAGTLLADRIVIQSP